MKCKCEILGDKISAFLVRYPRGPIVNAQSSRMRHRANSSAANYLPAPLITIRGIDFTTAFHEASNFSDESGQAIDGSIDVVSASIGAWVTRQTQGSRELRGSVQLPYYDLKVRGRDPQLQDIDAGGFGDLRLSGGLATRISGRAVFGLVGDVTLPTGEELLGLGEPTALLGAEVKWRQGEFRDPQWVVKVGVGRRFGVESTEAWLSWLERFRSKHYFSFTLSAEDVDSGPELMHFEARVLVRLHASVHGMRDSHYQKWYLYVGVGTGIGHDRFRDGVGVTLGLSRQHGRIEE